MLPNGRYDEARGARKSAYQGRYEIRGDHIDYWDDTGFTADGSFVSDGELHHGGHDLPPGALVRSAELAPDRSPNWVTSYRSGGNPPAADNPLEAVEVAVVRERAISAIA